MTSYPCIESTHEVLIGTRYRVRLWVAQNSVEDEYPRTAHAIQLVVAGADQSMGRAEIAHRFAAMSGMNAVQVIELVSGEGTMVYINWP